MPILIELKKNKEVNNLPRTETDEMEGIQKVDGKSVEKFGRGTQLATLLVGLFSPIILLLLPED
jgi:hypothetical protein